MEEDYKKIIEDISNKVNEMNNKFNEKVPDISLITENDAVKFLGVSKVTLNSWRKKNILIKNKHYIRIGRSIRYKTEALLNYKNN
tara:strand:+ start:279 stop:533 length:255 start_codon:yes stop_codon:yes gene_type:complete